MMGVRTVFSLFCDCWKLYSKYADSNLGDEELQQFIEQAQEIYYKKYPGEPFTKDMVLAVISEIDRIEKVKNR